MFGCHEAHRGPGLGDGLLASLTAASSGSASSHEPTDVEIVGQARVPASAELEQVTRLPDRPHDRPRTDLEGVEEPDLPVRRHDLR